MSQFYFHFRTGDFLAEDDVGMDLPDLDAVRVTTLDTAREMLAARIKSGSRAFDEIIVTNEGRDEVYRLPAKEALPEELK